MAIPRIPEGPRNTSFSHPVSLTPHTVPTNAPMPALAGALQPLYRATSNPILGALRAPGDGENPLGAWGDALREAWPDNVLTPLQKAMVANDMPAMRRLLADGADIEEQDTKGHTALHIAALLNSEKFVAYLLELGANIHADDHVGFTPAYLAVRFHALGSVDVLVDEARSLAPSTTPWRDGDMLVALLRAMVDRQRLAGPLEDGFVDALVRRLTGAEEHELQRMSKLNEMLVYHAHLLSLTGKSLGMELEGWYERDMLVQRIRTLVRVAIRPETFPADMDPQAVGNALARCLRCDLEQLRLINRLVVLKRMGASPRRDQLLREEARHVTTLITSWPQGEEFSIPTGFAAHSAYVTFSHQVVDDVPVVTVRLDNLGATQSHAQFTDGEGRVAPLTFNVPVAFLQNSSGSDAFMHTVEQLLFARVDPNDDHVLNSALYTLMRQLKRVYLASFVDNTPFTAAADHHKPQTVGNCVLKNHSAGLCARLGRPLFRWFKQREVQDVESRLNALMAAGSLRACEEEKWQAQCQELLHGKSPSGAALRTFLAKPGRDMVLKTMGSKTWRAIVALNDPDALRCVRDHGAQLPPLTAHQSTLLHWAVEARAGAVVAFLLESGAPVDATDEQGATPLHLALRHGDAALVDQLLQHGAAMDTADDKGITPKDLARDEVRKAARLRNAFRRAFRRTVAPETPGSPEPTLTSTQRNAPPAQD